MFALLGIKTFPDFCGVAGLFVSVIGLIAVWKQAKQAKDAARAASDAARETRNDLNKFDAISTLSDIINTIEEVKTLQRDGVWDLTPTKYAHLKQSLITVRALAPGLSAQQKKDLLGTIQTCAGIEDEIETAIATETVPNDVPRFNRVLGKHALDVQSIVLHIRNQIG